MDWTRLQTRQAKLVQPSADRVLMHMDRKTSGNFGLKINATPANHAIDLRVGTSKHQSEQFRLL